MTDDHFYHDIISRNSTNKRSEMMQNHGRESGDVQRKDRRKRRNEKMRMKFVLSSISIVLLLTAAMASVCLGLIIQMKISTGTKTNTRDDHAISSQADLPHVTHLLQIYTIRQLGGQGDKEQNIQTLVEAINEKWLDSYKFERVIKDLEKILRQSDLTALEINNAAEGLQLPEKYLQSIMLYYVAAKVHSSSTNNAVSFKQKKIHNIYKVIPSTQSELDAIMIETSIIPLMEDLVADMALVKNATSAFIAEYQAWGRKLIASTYLVIKRFKNTVETLKTAISLLRNDFGYEVVTYRIYGFCLNDAGVAYEKLGNYEKSLQYFRKAGKAFLSVKDWMSEGEKKTETERVAANTKIVEAKLQPPA